MSQKTRSNLLKYSISVGVCLLVAAAMLWNQPLLTMKTKELYRCLSDALFLPGALMVFMGLLVFVSNEGMFNGVGYIVHVAVHAFIPGGRNTMEKYGDYVAARQKKKTVGYGFLFVVGAVFVLLGLVFSLLFSYA